jgi:TPR repeat protein
MHEFPPRSTLGADPNFAEALIWFRLATLRNNAIQAYALYEVAMRMHNGDAAGLKARFAKGLTLEQIEEAKNLAKELEDAQAIVNASEGEQIPVPPSEEKAREIKLQNAQELLNRVIGNPPWPHENEGATP